MQAREPARVQMRVRSRFLGEYEVSIATQEAGSRRSCIGNKECFMSGENAKSWARLSDLHVHTPPFGVLSGLFYLVGAPIDTSNLA